MFTCKTRRAGYLLAILLFVFAGALQAAGPGFINYRATLNDNAGNPVPNGTYLVHFAVYDVESGDDPPRWTEDHTITTNKGGFKVKLGEYEPIDETVFGGPDRWIGIAIDPDSEMAPRTPIGNVPWSLNAGFAESVANEAVGQAQLQGESVGSAQLQGESVGSAHLQGGSVGSAHLQSGAVGSAHLQSGAVGTAQLQGESVGTAQLTPNAVGKAQIQGDAVGDDEIVDGSVKLAELSGEGALPGQIIKLGETGSWEYDYDNVGAGETYWTTGPADDVLTTTDPWGLARSGTILLGGNIETHVNLGGPGSQTGSLSSNASFCTIGGGAENTVASSYSTVAGGWDNSIALDDGREGYGFIGGGTNNSISDSGITASI